MKRSLSITGTAAAIILLAALALPLLFSWYGLRTELKQVKRAVKERMIAGLSPSELVTLEFDADQILQLEWEHETEFVYQGKFFDVVDSEVLENGNTCYICFPDKQETELNRKLAGLWSLRLQKPLPGQDTQQRVVLMLKQLCLPLYFQTEGYWIEHYDSHSESSFATLEGITRLCSSPPEC